MFLSNCNSRYPTPQFVSKKKVRFKYRPFLKAARNSRSGALGGWGRLSALNPPFERSLTFARRLSSKKTLHTNIFIYVLPVDPLTFSYKPPVRPFSRARMLKARVPTQRNRNSASITKVNGQSVRSCVDIHGMRDFYTSPERFSTDTWTNPCSVNFTALLIRFLSTCPMSFSSPVKYSGMSAVLTPAHSRVTVNHDKKIQTQGA